MLQQMRGTAAEDLQPDAACDPVQYAQSVVNGVDDSGEPLYATEASVQSACNDNDACPGYYQNPTFPAGKQWRPFKSAPGVRPNGFWSPGKFPVVKKKVVSYQYTTSVVNGV